MTITETWPRLAVEHVGPLSGVRVLDFSEIIAAPFCAMLLIPRRPLRRVIDQARQALW
jgi:hypothetical protein